MSKYQEFDAALLKAIRNGADNLSMLCVNPTLKKLAEPLRTKDRWGHLTDVVRIIDRRLQAQRKGGVITYHAGRWHVLGKSA